MMTSSGLNNDDLSLEISNLAQLLGGDRNQPCDSQPQTSKVEQQLDEAPLAGDSKDEFPPVPQLLKPEVLRSFRNLIGIEHLIPSQRLMYDAHRYRIGGGGFRQDLKEAESLYGMAIVMDPDNAEALFYLALLYRNGAEGIEADPHFAKKLLEKAAELPTTREVGGVIIRNGGVIASQHALGNLLTADADGVEVDYEKALFWYKKAASNGNGFAAYSLAHIYVYGIEGVLEIDLKVAEDYLKMAVGQGNKFAAFYLCLLYVKLMEPEAARRMFDKSLQLGHEDLRAIREIVFQKIDEVEKARSLVEKEVLEFEKRHQLSNSFMTFLERKERTQRPLQKAETPVAPVTVTYNKKFDEDYLLRRSEAGSVTARNILKALKYNARFLELWATGGPLKSFSEEQEKTLIDLLYTSITADSDAIEFHSDVATDILAFVNALLTKQRERKEMDHKVRVCFAYFVMQKKLDYDLLAVVAIRLWETLVHVQREPSIYIFLSGCYSALKDHEKGLLIANLGLARTGENPDLLFLRAHHLISQNSDLREKRKAAHAFLKKAPADHCRVPEAYYIIALTYLPDYLQNDEVDQANDNRQTMKYLKLGQDAEKLQLECNLPVVSECRDTLNQILASKSEGNKPEDSKVEVSSPELYSGFRTRINLAKINEAELLQRQNERRSETVGRILTTIQNNAHFLQVWSAGSLKSFTEEQAHQLISCLVASVCSEMDAISFPEGVRHRVVIFVVQQIAKEGQRKSERIHQLWVLYAYFILTSEEVPKHILSEVIQILWDCLERYSEDPQIYIWLARFYGELHEFLDALAIADTGLHFFPKNVELLLLKARLRFVLVENAASHQEWRREAYEAFLESAPQDHPSVPEAHYCIAWTYARSSKGDGFAKMLKAFEAGKEAECHQLECYLPYDFHLKEFLTKVTQRNPAMIEVIADKIVKSKATYLEDPGRVGIIKSFRREQKLRQSMNVTTFQPPPATGGGLGRKVDPSLTLDLTPIMLKDMSMADGRMYRNWFLSLTLIDDPIISAGAIRGIGQDENGDVVRLTVFNTATGGDKQKLEEGMSFGSDVLVKHPVVRREGSKIGIEVDDHERFLICGKARLEMCRYCGAENATSSCSKCKRVKYCSKQCQVKDWKELGHKLVCRVEPRRLKESEV